MFLEDKEWNSADKYCEKVLDIDPECAEAYLGKLMVELNVTSRQNLKNCSTPFDGRNNFQKAMRFGDENLKKELQGYIDFIINRNLINAYNDAVRAMNSANTEEAYIKASAKFKELHDFKDSKELAKECLDKAEETRLTVLYNSAMSAMNSADTEQQYKSAASKFAAIRTFRDAEDKMKLCSKKATISRKDAVYNSAVALMETATIVYLKNAIEQFKAIGDWKDCASKIYDCERLLYDLEQKAEAERLEAERLAEEKRLEEERIVEEKRLEKERQAEIARKEAERIAKRNKKIAIITTSIVCAIIAFIIVLNTVIIPNNKYNDAIALMDAGKYSEAISAFEALDGYKDSINKIEECNVNIYGEEVWNKINLTVGEMCSFGSYEQDNNKSNGQEDIEWLVLAKEGTKILVISKEALDCKPYNTSYTDATWETCTLRKWLNNDFINAAFSADEKAMIPTVTVSADKNPHYSTNPGNATQDQVFLLSITEVNKYFSSDGARRCKPTDYAVANGAYVSSFNGNCWWWLRSPGYYQGSAASVNLVGDVYGYGHSVDIGDNAVRPALWIDLNS